MAKPDGGPAFPSKVSGKDSALNPTEYSIPRMSLRQWYKGKALERLDEFDLRKGGDHIAALCGMWADAMIKEDES